MLLPMILAGSTVQLRTDAVQITPGQAKAMSPAALGDALLARGHPTVVEAAVGPELMEPPTPPGRPEITRIRLYLAGTPSAHAGFCQRTIATIYLEPVDRTPAGDIPPVAADTLSTQRAFRWIEKEAGSADCAAPRHAFFTPPPEREEQALSTVRLLAAARDAARLPGRLPFEVFVEDIEGPRMAAFERAHPDLPPSDDWKPSRMRAASWLRCRSMPPATPVRPTRRGTMSSGAPT